MINNYTPQYSGLTEYWITIPGFKNYQVSNLGQVRSFVRYTYSSSVM